MSEIPTQRGPWDDDETAKLDAQDSEADRRRTHRNFGGDVTDPERVLPIATARGDAYLPPRHWPYGRLEGMSADQHAAFPGAQQPLAAYGVTYPSAAGDPYPTGQPLIVNVEQPRHSTYVEPPNHVLHGLLTLFTSGVWGVVWIWRVRKYRKAVRRANR